jgi:hypothetical protein
LFVLARPSQAQDTHLVVITGVSGDQEHSEKFHAWATALIDAARKNDRVPEDHIVYLAEKTDVDRRVRGRSTRENVEKTFADLARTVKADDEVVVVLFGHGSFDGRRAAFNLPGPDLAADEYAALLDKVAPARVAFINTASSSGAFLQALTKAGRVVVTATKTGGEFNETLFPEYFVDAFATDAADQNRDGRVSVLEAFEYARTKVTQAYQEKGLLLTEHAALEDGNRGAFAATLFLESDRSRAAAIAATADPNLRSLLQEKLALEQRIAALKLRKGSMDSAQYDQELETLVTELALKTRAIQQIEGKKP